VPFLESLDAMIELKRQGKLRHIALSNVSLAQLRQALERTPIVGVQNLYNVAEGERRLAKFQHAVVAEQERILGFCAQRGMAFLPFFPLTTPGPPRQPSSAIAAIAAQRKVTQAQVALAWLLARSPALVPIPGTSSVEHLEENWAARELELTAAEL